MEKRDIRFRDIALYALLALIANYVASLVSYWLLAFLAQTLGKTVLPNGSASFFSIIAALIALPLTVFFAAALLYLLLGHIISPLYESDAPPRRWLSKSLCILLPGELLRFFICLPTVGMLSRAGRFAIAPTLLFDAVYPDLSGRAYAIRQLGELIASDHLAYTVCYLIYAALYFFVLLAICRRFWLKGKQMHEDMIVS